MSTAGAAFPIDGVIASIVGAPPVPQSGQIVLAASNGTTFTTLIGGAPSRSGGVGGWQESNRVYRESASWFQATPLATTSYPCILDIGALPGAPLEDRMKTLRAMGKPGKDLSDPPSVRLLGDVGNDRLLTWRLDDVSESDQLFQPENFTRLWRVIFTISLTQLVVASGIEELTVRRTRDTPSKSRTRTVTVRAGQTLRSIAVEQLGQSSDYTQIQGWNAAVAKTDPDTPLRAGLKLVIR